MSARAATVATTMRAAALVGVVLSVACGGDGSARDTTRTQGASPSSASTTRAARSAESEIPPAERPESIVAQRRAAVTVPTPAAAPTPEEDSVREEQLYQSRLGAMETLESCLHKARAVTDAARATIEAACTRAHPARRAAPR